MTLLSLLLLSACGTNTADSTAPKTDTIKVGTMGTYNPFSYEDEAGQLTGYDLEVLRLVEKKDPSLAFEFVAGPWDSLFVGLDANKFQLLANQITSNPDRLKHYTLSETPYFKSVSQIIVKADNQTSITTLADLKGKKIGLTVGDSFTRIVEDWNKANGNILKINYYEQDITTILEDIENGRLDATVNDPIMAKNKAAIQKLHIKAVGNIIASDPTYFIATKDKPGKALMKKIDAALTSLKEEGSLAKLSTKWFDEDYTN
ncbi:transporter substrate-binding domain-containing protein [Brochothrix campestris]|uniref:Amino acid ABC transporter amino acid-binding protein/permease, his/glu/gln/arg/opine family n=1 Tax=Brochothrix campestris FSL F6-1037 TaxID=1265861 RepID=W7CY31_9LIST|nr:transporter substrate-binding domain-containing protein [Brochothrix campestris]EUJ40661.1 amino acid ABC transporter amino acid-binding protein/permease, his/glu/gln/arg/opine family [Brochothrix campestris FSL F6-1037]